MANYAFGLLLVIVILILALWVGDGRLNVIIVGSLVAIGTAACAHAIVGGGSHIVGGAVTEVARNDVSWFNRVDLSTSKDPLFDAKAQFAGKPSPLDVYVKDEVNEKPPALQVASRPARPGARLGVKITIKDVLRNTKSAFKTATAAAAVAASGGLAGDTVIELVSIVVDATLWLGQLATIFLNNTADYGATMSRIWALDFSRGAVGIHEDMKTIVAEAGGPTSAVFAEVRRVYSDTMDWLLSLLGTAISACVPDDAGVVGWAFSEITIMGLRSASANVWWIVYSLYNSLPEIARNMLQNPADLAKIAIYAIESVEKYVLAGGDDSWWQTLGKSLGRNAAITTATFGVLLLNPILMFPVAGTIFLSGQLANALYTIGIGNKQISAVLHALYERPVNVPGIGTMTAVDAMVMFMQKITVLTFAGLYILSDNSVAAADAPPAGFVPPGLNDLRDRAKTISVKPPPARVANVSDATDAQMEAVAAK